MMMNELKLSQKIEWILSRYFLVGWWRVDDNPVVSQEGIDEIYEQIRRLFISWGLDADAIDGFIEIKGELWMLENSQKANNIQPEDEEYKNAYEVLVEILNYYLTDANRETKWR